MSDSLYASALDYHRQEPAGKIAVMPTKPLATQRDLALAYSPGVAAACHAIVADPTAAGSVTARGIDRRSSALFQGLTFGVEYSF